MKTKSLIVLSIAVIALYNAATAQHATKTDGAYINGLKVGDKYTKTQLINVFGKPKEMKTSIEDPNFYILDYGANDIIYWMNNNDGGEFYGCDLETDKYSFCGVVKVGDSISAIDKLHGITTGRSSKSELYEGVICWKPNYPDEYKWEWLLVEFFYDNKGKIVRISVEIPFV